MDLEFANLNVSQTNKRITKINSVDVLLCGEKCIVYWTNPHHTGLFTEFNFYHETFDLGKYMYSVLGCKSHGLVDAVSWCDEISLKCRSSIIYTRLFHRVGNIYF